MGTENWFSLDSSLRHESDPVVGTHICNSKSAETAATSNRQRISCYRAKTTNHETNTSRWHMKCSPAESTRSVHSWSLRRHEMFMCNNYQQRTEDASGTRTAWNRRKSVATTKQHVYKRPLFSKQRINAWDWDSLKLWRGLKKWVGWGPSEYGR